MISVKKVNNKPLNLLERIYLREIARGIAVTTRHFFTNLLNPKGMPTIRYPEQTRPLPGNANLRTRHRLKMRSDGSPKCVACFMCQTACPAYCIHIEAAEYTENTVEKYPAVFDIDLSRCVMCGMCVEACPEDAIAMDTREIPGGALTREEMIMTKESLLRNLPDGSAHAQSGNARSGYDLTTPSEEEPSRKGAANRLANEYLKSRGEE